MKVLSETDDKGIVRAVHAVLSPVSDDKLHDTVTGKAIAEAGWITGVELLDGQIIFKNHSNYSHVTFTAEARVKQDDLTNYITKFREFCKYMRLYQSMGSTGSTGPQG